MCMKANPVWTEVVSSLKVAGTEPAPEIVQDDLNETK